LRGKLAAETTFVRTHSRHARAAIAFGQGRVAVRRWTRLHQPLWNRREA
jgi:hypothetical protein